MSTVIATRVPDDVARSIKRIAELRRSTTSTVAAAILCEQVAPLDERKRAPGNDPIRPL